MIGAELQTTLQQPDLLTSLVVLIPIVAMSAFLGFIDKIFSVKSVEYIAMLVQT